MCDHPSNFRCAPLVNKCIHRAPCLNTQESVSYNEAYTATYQKGYNKSVVQIPVKYGLGFRIVNVDPREKCNTDQQVRNYEDYKKSGGYGTL